MYWTVFVLLTFLLSGFVAGSVFEVIRYGQIKRNVITGLIFDFLIIVVNTIGIFYFTAVNTVSYFETCLKSMRFMWKYSLLSIFVGIVLAVLIGLILKIFNIRGNLLSKDKKK